MPVRDVAKEAVSTFSTKNSGGTIPLVLIPSHRLFTSMFLSIPTGCFCLMQRFGKHDGLANPGISFKPPWYRVAYVVTRQSCTYNAPVKECPTADNVRVSVDMVIVFMIRDPVDFVYKLGAVHFDQLLSGAVDESIRILVRSHNHDNVYTLRGNRAVEVLTHLNQKFDSCGVVFSNCTIKSVELPESLMACHENATNMKKAMAKAKRQQEFEIGEIKRRSEIELEELRWKCDQALVVENGRKKHAELEHEQKLVKASEQLQNATIETQQKIQVRLMEARALLDRTRTEMEKTKVEMLSKAKVDAEATKVQADIGYETTLLHAEAERQRLSGEAKAIKMDADAEREASRHLTHKRKHEIEMREKEILTKLAQKANYNMIGESGDKIVGAMLTGHLNSGSQGGVGSWFK